MVLLHGWLIVGDTSLMHQSRRKIFKNLIAPTRLFRQLIQ
jgi:hypothetical protein